jgi:hypothetical protein
MEPGQLKFAMTGTVSAVTPETSLARLLCPLVLMAVWIALTWTERLVSVLPMFRSTWKVLTPGGMERMGKDTGPDCALMACSTKG